MATESNTKIHQTSDNDSTSSNEDDVPISFDLNALAEEHAATQRSGQSDLEEDADEEDTENKDKDDEIQENLFPNLSPREEHVKMVLLSRRKENGTMKSRRELLFSFVFSQNHTHLRSFFHPAMEDNLSLINLHDNLMKCRVRKHDTTKQFLGEALFVLFMLLQESDQLKDSDHSMRNTRRGSEPMQLKNLRTFFLSITNRYDFDEVNASDKKQRAILSQNKSGDLIQDEYAKNNPDWQSRIISAPCPLCNHNCVVPHERDEDILEEISNLKEEWLKKRAAFANLPPAEQEKSKKPKQPTYPKQHVLCMCMVNRCRDFTTGKGCINCKSTVKCGMKLSYNPTTGHSNCSMCKCSCSAYFKRIEWSKLKSQVEVDKEKAARDAKEKRLQEASGMYYFFYNVIYTKQLIETHNFILKLTLLISGKYGIHLQWLQQSKSLNPRLRQ